MDRQSAQVWLVLHRCNCSYREKEAAEEGEVDTVDGCTDNCNCTHKLAAASCGHCAPHSQKLVQGEFDGVNLIESFTLTMSHKCHIFMCSWILMAHDSQS